MIEPLEERREAKTTAAELRRSLKYLTIATVTLAVLLLAGGLKVYLDGRATKNSLCTLREDLANRAIASTKFLAEHPEGIPGIPPKVILEGIYNQQRTIVALKNLDCKNPPEEALKAIPTPPKP